MKVKKEKPKSEFPETRFSKYFRKLGWLFSPFLLIFLIILTLYTAEGIENIDFRTLSVTRRGAIEIKEVNQAKIYIDGKEAGEAPKVISIENDSIVNLSVIKENKREWLKTVKPKEGFVQVYYPILYPENIDFNSRIIPSADYYSSPFANFFFYLNYKDQKLTLNRYSVEEQLFGSSVEEVSIADITDLITQHTNSENNNDTDSEVTNQESKEVSLKEYNIIPGNTGKYALLTVQNENAYILQEGKDPISLPNFRPTNETLYFWSPDDSHLVFQLSNDIYSYELSSGRVFVIHRSIDTTESVKIQFTLKGGIIYIIQKPLVTDLVQNTLEGNKFSNIDLPNIDNIRKDNLAKVFDFSKEENILILQSDANIYTFDIETLEINKLNLFKGENIVFADKERQLLLTINPINPNQFRMYNLDLNESKSFEITEPPIGQAPNQIASFNGSQNLLFTYEDRVILLDIDGSNQINLLNLKNPKITLATRIDDNIQLAFYEQNEENRSDTTIQILEPNLKELRFEIFDN